MGSDIRMTLEFKEPINDNSCDWIQFCEFTLPRNYDVFAALAFGKNADPETLRFKLRGFPSDASTMAFSSFYSGEFYSPSWMSLKEFLESLHYFNIDEVTLELGFKAMIAATQSMEDLAGPENVRLLFWFSF